MNDQNTDPNRKIEIGILEVRRHIPIIYSFSKIFKTKDTNVTIFTTKELLSQLTNYLKDTKEYNIVLKEDNETIYSFIRRVKKICDQKIDLLFVNTIHETVLDIICYLKFRPKSKTVILVHHVNAWLKPQLVCKILHPIRTFDTNMSSVLIHAFIFPKFDAINVIYRPLKDYIKTHTNYDQEIFTLPTSIFDKTTLTSDSNDNEAIKIVIPGLIQEHRKDYDVVFTAFSSLFKQHKNKIKLIIPGLPVGLYGKRIYEKFKNLRDEGYDIVIFDKYVPDDIFGKLLTESDIILAPIKIKTRADNDIEEEYGKTVGSGVIFNAIQYAKPIIVPYEFNMLPELKSSTLTYKNPGELENIINTILSDYENLKKLKQEALVNAEKFSLDTLQNYFEQNVLSWVKKE